MIPVAGLLDIEVVPLEFETVTTRPTLEVVSHTRGKFEVSRQGGEFTPVKVQSDTSNFARQARIQAYNAHKYRPRSTDGELDYSHMRGMANIPSLSGKSYSSVRHRNDSIARMAFEYTPEEVNFNWVREEKVLKATPGKVDFYITQYPEVLIDYLGGPIYCPPTSAPGYEAPAVNMVV